jgi:hypothetical protein
VSEALDALEGTQNHRLIDVDPIELTLRRAFAPYYKRALGLASGIVAALTVFAVTAFHVVAAPAGALHLELLAQYFYGYDVTWRGAFVGAWWSFVAGFVAGWFLAFVYNFVLATWLFLIRTKADMSRTTDFLDHI